MNKKSLPSICVALLPALPVIANAGRGEAEIVLTRTTGDVAAAERAGAPQSSPVEPVSPASSRVWRSTHANGANVTTASAAFRFPADSRLAEARTRLVTAEAPTKSRRAAVETLRAKLARPGAAS